MQVISFKDFKETKRFPVYATDAHLLQPLASLDIHDAVCILISHPWFEVDPRVADLLPGSTAVSDELTRKVTETPDSIHRENYSLCVNAIQSIIKHSNKTAAYLWIDCACMNLDSAEPKPLWAIMEFADCMLTPVPGDDIFSVSFTGRYSYFSDYHAHLWNGSRTAYINRASCRMDMLYAAAVPISEAQLEKSKTFGSGLFLAMREGRRAHFLFGSKEQRERSSPVYLPPLQYSYLEALYPLKGYFTSDSEKSWVEQQLLEIKSYIRPPASTFNGSVFYSELMLNGRGERVYPCGDRYRGGFSFGLRHGRGKYFYAGGESCEGSWTNGISHGESKILYADGSTYEGLVAYDSLSGEGIMMYANADTYVGGWERNKPHGNGTYTWANGASYTGGYIQGVFHGYGTFTSIDKVTTAGMWNKGFFARRFTFPLEKQFRWISKALMVDVSSLRESNILRKIAIDNAVLRSEHCGHQIVQPETEPEEDEKDSDVM